MNEILEALFARKSMRAYTGEAVPAETKELILRAACAAPTAGNQQLYTILDITDQAVKDKLAVSCDNQPFIAEAEVVLIFCADCQKWYDAFVCAGCEPRLPRAGDLMLAVADCAIAAQNAVTAADSLGFGSCYIGDIMEQCETHRELLNLPEYVFPAVMLVIGAPTRQQLERPKPRRSTKTPTAAWTGRSCGKCLPPRLGSVPMRTGSAPFANGNINPTFPGKCPGLWRSI